MTKKAYEGADAVRLEKLNPKAVTSSDGSRRRGLNHRMGFLRHSKTQHRTRIVAEWLDAGVVKANSAGTSGKRTAVAGPARIAGNASGAPAVSGW